MSPEAVRNTPHSRRRASGKTPRLQSNRTQQSADFFRSPNHCRGWKGCRPQQEAGSQTGRKTPRVSPSKLGLKTARVSRYKLAPKGKRGSPELGQNPNRPIKLGPNREKNPQSFTVKTRPKNGESFAVQTRPEKPPEFHPQNSAQKRREFLGQNLRGSFCRKICIAPPAQAKGKPRRNRQTRAAAQCRLMKETSDRRRRLQRVQSP